MKTQQILTAMAALALVAGCSGGKQAAKATPTPGADSHRTMLEVAKCARAHGAPNFPDPVVNAKGEWEFPQAELDRQPQVTACDSQIMTMKRANPKSRPTVSPQDLVKLKAYAACMRQQGVSDWPDPSEDGVFRPPPRLRNPQRVQRQDKACFSKAPSGGIQVDGAPKGPPKGR